jgi:hypothetical protein
MRLLARTFALALLLKLAFILALREGYARTCYPPDEAAAHAEKDICVAAHVYNVVEAEDGTRYLDVCKPGTADEDCHLAILSMAIDRKDVGELAALREQDIQLRGTVHVFRGQSTLILSHARQFKDGPEKFRPNPTLLSAFNAGSGQMPIRDPALEGHKKNGKSVFRGTTPKD